MPSRDDYTKTLRTLASALKRQPMTAREIAERFNCARPVAYKRLRDLERLGYVVEATPCRKHASGPQALAYRVRRLPTMF